MATSVDDLLPRKTFTFQTLKSCPCQSIFSFCIPEKEPQHVVIIQAPLEEAPNLVIQQQEEVADGDFFDVPEIDAEDELQRIPKDEPEHSLKIVHESLSIPETIWHFIVMLSLFGFIKKSLLQLSPKNKLILSPKLNGETNEER